MIKLHLLADQALLHALRCIVIHALEVGVNGKLLTNAQFLEKYGIATGTIQRAITNLKQAQALITCSKGHLGRIITQIDTGLCWNIAKLKPIQLLMPSSGSIEIDIVIRHLTNKLSKLNIPYFITHHPGGENRISQVLDGYYDVALASKGAVNNMPEPISEALIKMLDSNTYYSLDRLVIVSRTGENRCSWKKIGIDYNSSDHMRITQLEFPYDKNFRYVETRFKHVPSKILRGEIDAGLWHITSSPVPLDLVGLQACMLKDSIPVNTHKNLSAATFVINPHRPELISILNELDSQSVVCHQKQAFIQEDRYIKAFDYIIN